MTGKHPLRFNDEDTPIDSTRYAQPLYVVITNLVLSGVFLFVFPIFKWIDRMIRGAK